MGDLFRKLGRFISTCIQVQSFGGGSCESELERSQFVGNNQRDELDMEDGSRGCMLDFTPYARW